MARPKRKNVEFNTESLEYEMSNLLKQLNEVRIKALRDYNEVQTHSNDMMDKLQYENIRANALKTIERFFDMRIKILKLQSDVTISINKASGKGGDGLDNTSAEELAKMAKELEKLKN